jgi:hypothetical protein
MKKPRKTGAFCTYEYRSALGDGRSIEAIVDADTHDVIDEAGVEGGGKGGRGDRVKPGIGAFRALVAVVAVGTSAASQNKPLI